MGQYAIRRIAACIPVIFGLITVVFFLMRLLPGDRLKQKAAFRGG